MNLLHSVQSVVNKESKMAPPATSTQTQSDTDHRMAPQNRVLEDQYSIQFPSKRQNSSVSSSPTFLHDQEKDDFLLALKMQQAEMETTTEFESSSAQVENVQRSLYIRFYFSRLCKSNVFVWPRLYIFRRSCV